MDERGGRMSSKDDSHGNAISLSILSLLDWLNSEPGLDDICRGIVLGYMHQYEPSKSRIVQFNNEDSLLVLSDYGYLSAVGHASKTLTPAQWRQSTSDFSKLLGCQEKFYWNRNSSAVVVPFKPRGVVSGALSIGFDLPQRKTEEIGAIASQLGMAIALYVNLTSDKRANAIETHISHTSHNSSEYENIREAFSHNQNQNKNSRESQMTGRQIQILEGLIEGKTNFEIAGDLGYSVSTVRQETIKIYSMLNVTGRRAAAQEAMRQKII
jgi:DNA-binding CsgD family transcriptional regulator